MIKGMASLLILAGAVLGLAGCDLFRPNQAPVVIITYSPANPYQGDAIFLDARQTTDPEGDDLSFAWSLIMTPEDSFATLDAPTDPSTSFNSDFDGDYEVRLTVCDGHEQRPGRDQYLRQPIGVPGGPWVPSNRRWWLTRSAHLACHLDALRQLTGLL